MRSEYRLEPNQSGHEAISFYKCTANVVRCPICIKITHVLTQPRPQAVIAGLSQPPIILRQNHSRSIDWPIHVSWRAARVLRAAKANSASDATKTAIHKIK